MPTDPIFFSWNHFLHPLTLDVQDAEINHTLALEERGAKVASPEAPKEVEWKGHKITLDFQANDIWFSLALGLILFAPLIYYYRTAQRKDESIPKFDLLYGILNNGKSAATSEQTVEEVTNKLLNARVKMTFNQELMNLVYSIVDFAYRHCAFLRLPGDNPNDTKPGVEEWPIKDSEDALKYAVIIENEQLAFDLLALTQSINDISKIVGKGQNQDLIIRVIEKAYELKLQGDGPTPLNNLLRSPAVMAGFADIQTRNEQQGTPDWFKKSSLGQKINDIDPKDENGNYLNILHTAAIEGWTRDKFDLLVKFGANVNLADSVDKLTPLHCACTEGQVEVVKTLTSLGADFHPLTHENLARKRPIYYAAYGQHQAIVDHLNPEKYSLGKMAIDDDNPAGLQWLLDRELIGPNDLCQANQRVPENLLQYAKRLGRQSCITWLKNQGAEDGSVPMQAQSSPIPAMS